MRKWRVGTFSMGITLILLGVVLFTSQILGFNITHIMLSWWPIILVVLGIEILIFLFKAKDKEPLLKYDFLSILFVGIIGTVGIGFAVLQTTGLMDRVEYYVSGQYQTFDLPQLNYDLDKDVKRIVVDTGTHPLTIEGTLTDEISMFGTYGTFFNKKENVLNDAKDYALVHKKGDTLYISLKDFPDKYDHFNSHTEMDAVLLVPQHVKLEVNGNYNELTIKPRKLTSNWLIDQASSVAVQLQEKGDVLLTANDIREITSEQKDWKIEKEAKVNDSDGVDVETFDGENIKNATYKQGEGTNLLQLRNITYVSLAEVK